MTTNSTNQTDGQKLLNVRDLAKMLQVSNTSVYRLVESRRIPFVRLPRGLRFRETDVDEFLSRRTVDAIE